MIQIMCFNFISCSEQQLADDQYALYGVKTTGRIPRNVNQLYDPTRYVVYTNSTVLFTICSDKNH